MSPSAPRAVDDPAKAEFPLGWEPLVGMDPTWWATFCAIEDEMIRREPALQRIERELCVRNHLYFLQRYFWIQDKVTAKPVRLLPNAVQLGYEADRAEENVVLKARKMGASTWIDGRMFWRAWARPNQNGVIVAHLADSTEELFARVRFAEERLAPWLKRPVERSTTTMLKFEDQNSKIRVLTAGGKGEVGRGGDVDALHLSELAFYPNAERLLLGVGEALRSGAWLDIESTANGYEEFRVQYVTARGGASGRKAFFFPWWTHPDNRLPEERSLEALELTKDEAALVEAAGLDSGQVAWRRKKRSDLKDKFLQEHPETDETCFLTSGNPRFDQQVLARLLPLVESRVQAVDVEDDMPSQLHTPHLVVWVPPREGRRYLVAADVAGGGGGDADYSWATVLDVTERGRVEQVARYRSNTIRPGPYGRLLAALGLWYNEALIAPEENNHGHATLYALQQADYWNLYYHVDLITGATRDTPGFPTNVATRAQMLDMLGECLSVGGMVIRDALFLRECLTFQVGDEIDLRGRAKTERQRSVKKDGAMANAIGYYVAMNSGPVFL